MKATVLGTGGAAGYPSPWCKCDNCTEAKRRGGKNIRGHSSLFIHPNVLIDLPPDLPLLAHRANVDLSLVTQILITHTHPDHFYPDLLVWHSFSSNTALDNFGCFQNVEELHVFGSVSACRKVLSVLSKNASRDIFYNIIVHPIAPWRSFMVSHFQITAVPANHHVDQDDALNFIISDGLKTLGYFIDTGAISGEVTNFLLKQKIKFDAILIDAGGGLRRAAEYTGGHMSIEMIKVLVGQWRENDILHEKSQVILSHLTHHSPPHDLFVGVAQKHNLVLAYDGLEVII